MVRSRGRLVRFRGAVVGRIVGSAFVRRCDLQRAIVRRLNALALHVEFAESLRARGVQEVRFIDAASGKELVAPLSDFFTSKAVRFDFGLGAQLALPLQHWRTKSENAQGVLLAGGEQ